MKTLLAFCVGLAVPLLAAAADEVDMAEIRRLGNHVQHIDGTHRDGPGDEYVKVMGPPADDNHKWFISVIGSKGCAACARLKADFRTDDFLRSLVVLADGDDAHSDTKTSWAHYNYFLADDASQKFRWEKIKVAAYPTIIVQPPLNRKYGDPATVVCQVTGYDGDGRKLASKIADGIKAYLVKQAERRSAARGGHRALPPPMRQQEDSASGHGQDDSIGVDPPWTPAPKIDPTPTPLPGPGPGPAPGPFDVLPNIFNIPPLKPAEPKPAPQPETPTVDPKIASTPEAVVVYDCQTEVTAEEERRIQALLTRLRAGGRVLRVRPVDAKDSPVAIPKDQLPAVIVTANGQVQDRISARLFPLLNPEPAPARDVGVADLPWSSILALLTTGFSIPAAIPLIVWGVGFIRSRRRAAGKPNVISDTVMANLPQLIAQAPAFIEALKKMWQTPPPPAPNTTATGTEGSAPS